MYKIFEESKKLKEEDAKYKCLLVIFVIAVMIYVLFFVDMKNLEIYDIYVFMFSWIIAMFFVGRIINCRRKYKKIYKENFVVEALADMLENIIYVPDSGFSQEEVERFEIVSMANEFRSEDYLKAKYKGNEFEQSDVWVEIKSDRHMETYFCGRMIKFKIKKNIMEMQVFSEKYQNRKIGYLCRETVKMEDVEFNRMFDVYSYNSQDAFYILTPQLMEKFKEMSMNGKYLAMHLKENTVVVALWGHNSFELGTFGQIDCQEELYKMKDDIQNTIEILDLLNI